jgi:hypothetical protein
MRRQGTLHFRRPRRYHGRVIFGETACITSQSTRTHNNRRRLRRKCWRAGHLHVIRRRELLLVSRARRRERGSCCKRRESSVGCELPHALETSMLGSSLRVHASGPSLAGGATPLRSSPEASLANDPGKLRVAQPSPNREPCEASLCKPPQSWVARSLAPLFFVAMIAQQT